MDALFAGPGYPVIEGRKLEHDRPPTPKLRRNSSINRPIIQFTCTYIYLYVYIHIYTYLFIYIHTHIYMSYIHIYAHTYTHIHIFRLRVLCLGSPPKPQLCHLHTVTCSELQPIAPNGAASSKQRKRNARPQRFLA